MGILDEQGRLGVQQAAEGHGGEVRPPTLFDDTPPRWVKVDASAVRVENCRQFGGP